MRNIDRRRVATSNKMNSNSNQFQPEPHRVHKIKSTHRQPEPTFVHHNSSTSKATTELVSNISESSPGCEQQSIITDRNHLTISVKNCTFSALLDTGACRSVCSLHVVKQLKYSVKPHKSDQILITAGGSLLKIIGIVELPIKIQDLILHHTFYVIDRVVDEIVLGVDFLEIMGAKIDMKSKTISFHDDVNAQLTVISPHGKQFVSTNNKVILEPMSESVIPVSIVKSYPLHQPSLIEPLPNSHQKFCIGRSVVNINEGHHSVCRLLNPTDSVITIAKDSVIATIEPIDDECANIFSVDSDNETAVKTCQTNVNKMLTPEERQKILSDLGVRIGNGHLSPETIIELENLIAENADIFAKEMADLPPAKLEKFKIDTGTASPIRQRSYKQSPEAKREIERQVNKMLEAKLISPSNSVWSSPVILVKKKAPQNSPNAPPEYRMCVDYRKINQVIKQESFPLPLLQDTIDSLSENPPMYFCSLDFKSAYSSIELHPDTREKLTFVTHLGSFVPHRLGFGVASAPSFFQRVLSGVFRDMQYKYLSVYIDDVLCFFNDVESMTKAMREIFERIRKFQLRLNGPKCVFGVTEIAYLGHILTRSGQKVDPSKIDAMVNFPKPTNQRETRQYLGLTQYYKKFIEGYAKIAAPLNQLLRKDMKTKFEWTDDCDTAFLTLKQKLTTTPILSFVDLRKPFIITTDGSLSAISWILSQIGPDGREHPCFYGGRSLHDSEKNYGITDIEGLALVSAIKEHSHILMHNSFTVYTDHISLTWLNTIK